jgi:hypothetical protein
MNRRSLCTAENLFDFFHQRVEDAATHQGLEVSQDGVYYLSNLLVERTRTERSGGGETMVELSIRAGQGDRIGAIKAWREMGDRALYVSGFFRSSIARGPVGVDYYLDMGASAYDRLSRMLRVAGGTGGGFEDVFGELSESFRQCSEVLDEVRQEVRERTDLDIVKLYEEWLATGSPRVADRLRELGVIPMRPGGHEGPVS